jgi:hypothetical protein
VKGTTNLPDGDIIAKGDDDLHRLPLSMRKTNLKRLLARRPEGLFVKRLRQVACRLFGVAG